MVRSWACSEGENRLVLRRRRRKRGADVSPIHAFGLFWQTDEIDWFPGRGKRDAFRLLGRQGKYASKLRIADFREQRGMYILYGNYGPHYAGLTQRQALVYLSCP